MSDAVEVRVVLEKDGVRNLVYQRTMPVVPAVGTLLNVMGYNLRVVDVEHRYLEPVDTWVAFIMCRDEHDVHWGL